MHILFGREFVLEFENNFEQTLCDVIKFGSIEIVILKRKLQKRLFYKLYCSIRIIEPLPAEFLYHRETLGIE